MCRGRWRIDFFAHPPRLATHFLWSAGVQRNSGPTAPDAASPGLSPTRCPRSAHRDERSGWHGYGLTMLAFRTDGPTFVVLLIGMVVLTAGLMALPALTLGPIVEALQ